MHVATLRKPLSTLLPTKAESRDAISAASLLLRLHGNTTPASLLFKSRRLSGVGLLTKRIAARSRFSAVLVSAATRFRAVKIDSSLHISLKKHEVVLCSILVRVTSYDKAPHYISQTGLYVHLVVSCVIVDHHRSHQAGLHIAVQSLAKSRAS